MTRFTARSMSLENTRRSTWQLQAEMDDEVCEELLALSSHYAGCLVADYRHTFSTISTAFGQEPQGECAATNREYASSWDSGSSIVACNQPKEAKAPAENISAVQSKIPGRPRTTGAVSEAYQLISLLSSSQGCQVVPNDREPGNR
ncbi:hypothetical protein DOTSEDRAFT_37920 [Dothistroma septosporum NZE10]|uniref:Uncharacterized protein n=1 Tax=Dothistroma septosporum (strain NZE10 / CBS 128990) TaxID=675120 RepID=N1PCB7_DOTSN|nr:hypothetical protein DOTSEDRAFT_37920 [Dothistroma septosporum NZE10]